MKTWALIFFTICVQVCYSQNLVPNPSFEQYFECPGFYNTPGRGRNFAPGWTSPTQGTPDLFNRCSLGNAGVPHNWAGVAHAHKGYGYSGIYAWISNNYREYLQAKLLDSLRAGQKYKVEFFYRLSTFSKYGVDRIGVLLSDSIQQIQHDRAWAVTPSFTHVMDSAVSKKADQWIQARFEYMAKGGEKFISIGNFTPDKELKKFKLELAQVNEPLLSKAAYFYVDDVSVTLMEAELPKVDSVDLATKKVIKTNEVYILKKIYFEFDSYSLSPLSEPELNVLVSIMQKNPKWRVELSGHTDEKGNNLYNYNLSLNRAKSVGYYLTQSGIVGNRVITKGFGKLKPLSKAKTDAAHALNRRVEVKFLDK